VLCHSQAPTSSSNNQATTTINHHPPLVFPLPRPPSALFINNRHRPCSLCAAEHLLHPSSTSDRRESPPAIVLSFTLSSRPGDAGHQITSNLITSRVSVPPPCGPPVLDSGVNRLLHAPARAGTRHLRTSSAGPQSTTISAKPAGPRRAVTIPPHQQARATATPPPRPRPQALTPRNRMGVYTSARPSQVSHRGTAMQLHLLAQRVTAMLARTDTPRRHLSARLPTSPNAPRGHMRDRAADMDDPHRRRMAQISALR